MHAGKKPINIAYTSLQGLLVNTLEKIWGICRDYWRKFKEGPFKNKDTLNNFQIDLLKKKSAWDFSKKIITFQDARRVVRFTTAGFHPLQSMGSSGGLLRNFPSISPANVLSEIFQSEDSTCVLSGIVRNFRKKIFSDFLYTTVFYSKSS